MSLLGFYMCHTVPPMLREEQSLVAIVAENEADMELMDPCAAKLQKLGIAYQKRILSAVFDPDGMRDFAQDAWFDNKRVVIVGGRHGMTAGMIEAFGHRLNLVFVPLADNELEAKTALYSSVQMPNGHPVNVVGVNRPINGALSAAKMLSIAYPELLLALDLDHAENGRDAVQSNDRLQTM